jgi:hypothetical protein
MAIRHFPLFISRLYFSNRRSPITNLGISLFNILIVKKGVLPMSLVKVLPMSPNDKDIADRYSQIGDRRAAIAKVGNGKSPVTFP